MLKFPAGLKECREREAARRLAVRQTWRDSGRNARAAVPALFWGGVWLAAVLAILKGVSLFEG